MQEKKLFKVGIVISVLGLINALYGVLINTLFRSEHFAYHKPNFYECLGNTGFVVLLPSVALLVASVFGLIYHKNHTLSLITKIINIFLMLLVLSIYILATFDMTSESCDGKMPKPFMPDTLE